MALVAEPVEEPRRPSAARNGEGDALEHTLAVIEMERGATIRGDRLAELLEYAGELLLACLSHARREPQSRCANQTRRAPLAPHSSLVGAGAGERGHASAGRRTAPRRRRS